VDQARTEIVDPKLCPEKHALVAEFSYASATAQRSARRNPMKALGLNKVREPKPVRCS